MPGKSGRPDIPLERHLQRRAALIAIDAESEMLNRARRNIADYTANSRSSLQAHDDFSITFAVDRASSREPITGLIQSGHLAAKLKFRRRCAGRLNIERVFHSVAACNEQRYKQGTSFHPSSLRCG